MNNLLFLPIEITITETSFIVGKECVATFNGLWQTKELSAQDIETSGISNITNQLPYEKITLAKYNVQPSSIPAHVDVQPTWTKTQEEYNHIKSNEPAGYRVVLVGSNDSLEVFDGVNWQTAKLPKVPFAYVLNSTEYKHRIKNESGRQTLYFRGFLNETEHAALINKNLEKYKEYAIYAQ
jgi:hypothetical protein